VYTVLPESLLGMNVAAIPNRARCLHFARTELRLRTYLTAIPRRRPSLQFARLALRQ
jgi:hypothetical protein